MGNKSNKKLYDNDHFPFVKVLVKENKIYPGSTITGNIEIDLTQREVSAKTIVIYLIQHEEYLYNPYDSDTEKKEPMSNFRSSKERNFAVLSVHSVDIHSRFKAEKGSLVSLKNTVYSFPFTLTVPKDCSPSLEYSSYTLKFSIKHHLVAKFFTNQGEMQLGYLIEVLSGNAKPGVEIKKASSPQNTIFKGVLSSDSLEKEKNIKLKFEVDNTKGTNLKKFIKLSLVRTIYLNKYSFSEKQMLFKTQEEMKIFGERIIINLKKGEKREYDLVLKSKGKVDLPSFIGSIISCKYFIKSTLYPDAMSLSKNRPRITFDVTLTDNPGLCQELSASLEAHKKEDFVSCPPVEPSKDVKKTEEEQEYLEMIELIGELNVKPIEKNENDEDSIDFKDISPVIYEKTEIFE